MWDKSSMSNTVNPISSCPEKFPSPLPMPPFVLPHPYPKNPYNMSSQRIDRWIILKHALCRRAPHIGGKEEDLQKQIYDRRVISSENLEFLSTDQPCYIRTFSFPERMSPQTSSLNKFLPNSCPNKVLLLFLTPNTLIYFIFNVNVVVH